LETTGYSYHYRERALLTGIRPNDVLEEQQLVALLVKVAVAASAASILMRFSRIQRLLLKDSRTLIERIQLALLLGAIFGAGAEARIRSANTYSALDLALESAIIGMLDGYATGLLTGVIASLPDMFDGKYMSMPLFAACGVLGGLMLDLAPTKEDIWHFSAFIDLNLYQLIRQAIKRKRPAFDRKIVERAAFNLICNAIVLLAEMLRLSILLLFKEHSTFSIARKWGFSSPLILVALAVTTLFSVSLPIRIWSSFRLEKKLELQQARLIEARLAALSNQINPHFLFNTLNSVSSLIRMDPDKARGMIYKLSNILRRLLRKAEALTPLRDEVSFIDDYLAIETIRFGDKLHFEKDIDERALDRQVPSMILQPIVENSIKHGLSSKVEGGVISLRVWLDGERLHIVVEDDGVGISEARLAGIFGHGIGVSNVNERLRVLYGTSYRMEVDSEVGRGTRTRIEIPEARLEMTG
jgi:two-component system, LytTR family, sensor kinase